MLLCFFGVEKGVGVGGCGNLDRYLFVFVVFGKFFM